MKLRKVNPLKIHVPEVRVTARMSEETNEQFQASVAAVGIDEPIKVFEVDGQLILSDGLHRLLEAIKNNLTEVDVYVRPGTMVDVLCNNLMSGHLRGTHPVSEMVRSIEELWKEHKLDSIEIAKRTGMTRDYVEKLQLISELTPMCRAALDEGKIKVGHAVALTKLTDPVRQETVLGQQLLYSWSVKDLEEHIRNVLEMVAAQVVTPPGAPPPPPPVVKCHFCKRVTDISDLANPNICSNCAGTLLTLVAQARADLAAEQPAKTE